MKKTTNAPEAKSIRTARRELRLLPEEDAKLVAAARAAHLPVTTWMRVVCLKAAAVAVMVFLVGCGGSGPDAQMHCYAMV